MEKEHPAHFLSSIYGIERVSRLIKFIRKEELMNEKRYADLIEKACKKFREKTREEIEQTAKKMFAREYSLWKDKDLVVMHARNVFTTFRVIPLTFH